jgi:hypothetical protein
MRQVLWDRSSDLDRELKDKKNCEEGRFNGVETFLSEHHRLGRVPVPKKLADLPDTVKLAHLGLGNHAPESCCSISLPIPGAD